MSTETEPSANVTIETTLNGTEVEQTVPAGTLLSAFLRNHEYLTGTHRGCETAKCGACTVLVDGEPVKSCNLLAAQVDGSSITTVEGLADGEELHPVQQAFWDCHGSQCGYCTPGFVTNAVALLEDNPDPSVDEIQDHLAGNICRCTGYTKIIESVQEAGDRMDGDAP
ncbi:MULTISPECIES: (2Fe-2S)-binding protein [Halobellus]|uniref:(2Fe-2S)-binding protein n=1 Tax=Halobellus TaxID=1073986 RepID=UPI00288009A4|nr:MULTISPECIES: 2Fe-2S iron-sulfur cluster-binding protein [unclassified Halobellus]